MFHCLDCHQAGVVLSTGVIALAESYAQVPALLVATTRHKAVQDAGASFAMHMAWFPPVVELLQTRAVWVDGQPYFNITSMNPRVPEPRQEQLKKSQLRLHEIMHMQFHIYCTTAMIV